MSIVSFLNWKEWRSKRRVAIPTHLSSQVDEEDLDYGPIVESEDFTTVEIPREVYPRLAKRFARDARIALAYPRRSESNRVIVHEWIVREARDRHVRHVDLARVLPIAIELTFMSTDVQLNARLMTMTPLYQERLRTDRTRLFARGKPTLFNWLGERFDEPLDDPR
jgi:hypothetical protein